MNNSDDNNTDMFGSLLKTMDDQCNIADYSRPKLVWASTFLAIFVAGFWCQIVALPATWRLAKKRRALLIMFNANLGHCLMLSVYIAICLEYFLLGHRPLYPLGIDGFYYSLVNALISFCYVLLAFNRFVAIFLPMHYDHIFSGRHSNLWVGACWLVSMLYSALINSKPELRTYHCLNEIVIGYLIGEGHLYQQSTYVIVVWSCNKFLTTFFALAPMTLYLAVIIRMVFQQYQNDPSSTTTAPDPSVHRERVRMFLVSLLSTLPSFVQWALSRVLFLMPDNLFSWVYLLHNLSFALFQLHQPFLLYWLSADFRTELHRDMGRMASLLLTKGDGQKAQQNNQINLQQINQTNTAAVIVPIRQQAWN